MPKRIYMLQQKIYDFYKKNKRSFVWREKITPYKIFISEVMLQQTQTARVVPKFENWMQKFPEIIMKVNNDSKGYPQVRLTAPKARTARVHRLVAEQFLEEPSQELISLCGSRTKVLVNHIDENKNNAHVNNLEWCSHTYNSMYSISNRKSIKGVETYNSILTDKDVLEIVNCLKLKLYSQTKLAELYNVKQITISNIWTGRSWNHVTGFSVTPRSYKKNIQGKSVSERKESQCV